MPGGRPRKNPRPVKAPTPPPDPSYLQKMALAIHKKFVQTNDIVAARDELFVLREMNDEWAHKQSEEIRTLLTFEMRSHPSDLGFKVIRETLKFDAPYSFDVFMRFMEFERDPRKKFYAPRRKIIKSLWVDPIQDLLDGKLDLLALSCPPGTGKSTIGNFALAFQMGRDPDKPNLASAHSGTLTESFYKSVMGLITDPEYTYKEIFPYKIADKNGMQQTIDLVKPHRFSTLTCRAINASLTGATRCEGLLYADDLVSGIEEAMNPDRLDNLWQKYTNDLKSRKKDGEVFIDPNTGEEVHTACRELHIATRWSVRDVIGRLETLYGDDPRCKFVTCPALDENDESNFDYEYGVGFSTKYFIDMRKNLDPVSWAALFMNEPIEREGILFAKDELQYFADIPVDSDGKIIEPDYRFAIADTKDKGADYGFMPIIWVYGNLGYVVDMVCDNGKPEAVEAKFVDAIIKYKAQACRFESNAAGGKIADKVDAELKKRGYFCNITRKYTTSNKETRIQVNSPQIKNRFVFRSNFNKSTDYGMAMSMLVSYVLSGRNKHDDVPDGMSMANEFWDSFTANKVTVMLRPF